MDKSVVYLRYRNGCLTGDELHSVGFRQVPVWSGLDADIRYVKKAGLFSPESSQELVALCFDKHKDECWGRRRRGHLDDDRKVPRSGAG